MVCPSCGAQVESSDRFCPSCGKELPATPASASSPGDSPTGASLPRYPGTSSESDQPGWGWPGAGEQTIGQRVDPGAAVSAFGAPLAGWWQRVGAALLDALILVIPFLIIGALLNAGFGHEHLTRLGTRQVHVKTFRGAGHTAFDLIYILVTGIYFSIMNGTGLGQTVGNRAPGIAVRDVATGAPIGLARGVLRWFVRTLLYVLFVLPGIVNDLFPLFNARRQTIADKAAHSVMIRLK